MNICILPVYLPYTCMKHLITIILIFVLFSCNEKKEESIDNSSISKEGSYILHDSIKLHDESRSFSYFNIEKIEKDTLLAFQYPVLNLSLFNKKGDFIKEISRQGIDIGQFSGQFIEPKWFNNKLYVLEEGAAFGISIFSQSLKFEKYINLNSSITDGFLYPKITSFAIEKDKNQHYMLYVSIASDKHNPYLPIYYEESFSIAKIELNENYNILKTDFYLKFNEFSSVQNAIKSNKRTWVNANTFFNIYKDFLCVKYAFDDNIYLIDKMSMKKVKQISLDRSFLKMKEKLYTNFSNPDMTPKVLTKDRLMIEFGNSDYQNIKIENNFAYILSFLPIPKEKIVSNPEEIQKMNIKPLLFKVDLQNGITKYYIFPEKYSAFSSDISNNYLYLISNTDRIEDPYLYKFSLK